MAKPRSTSEARPTRAPALTFAALVAFLALVAAGSALPGPAGGEGPAAHTDETPVRTAGPTEDRAERIAAGKLSFRVHCASCHGEAGRGDGPVAGDLRVAPADLTRLARGDKPFPAEEAAAAIDGRQPVRGHGTAEMPVWGLSFEARDRDAVRKGEVQERIRDLVLFIESIQEPPRP